MNKFDIRLKNMRLANNLSMSDLGKKCGLNNPDIRIGAYESGKRYPKKDMITKLAKALNVSERYLVYGIFDEETVIVLKDKGIYESEYVQFELLNCYYNLHLRDDEIKGDLKYVRQLNHESIHSKEVMHENNR